MKTIINKDSNLKIKDLRQLTLMYKTEKALSEQLMLKNYKERQKKILKEIFGE